ncbi:HTH domain-containing protein, partial [Pseudomonas aeruginosa]|nr:HTH domain-containing protein [Pseudomonas aeruginosa]
MSRSQRLLDLLQILRRHRYPVAGHVLAGELGISLRTLYRDIATLRQQGAHIDLLQQVPVQTAAVGVGIAFPGRRGEG